MKTLLLPIIEAATKWIKTKPRAKCKLPWEPIVVQEKKDNMKKASLFNERKPTNSIAYKP